MQLLLLYYSVAAMTTVSAAYASSVSAAPAWCCSCCWHEQQVSSKKGVPNFGDLELGSQNIYDTRLNGENLFSDFSDFRWCAPWRAAFGYAWCCRCCHCCTVLFGSQFTGCRHAPSAIKTACIPGLKECFYKQYMRFHAYAASMHTLLTPPPPPPPPPPHKQKNPHTHHFYQKSATIAPNHRREQYPLTEPESSAMRGVQ